MKLKEVIEGISTKSVQGTLDMDIATLEFDSRKCDAGSLFFALKGTQTDGHKYINNVISAGCKAIVCETIPADVDVADVCFIKVDDSTDALALAASNFFGNPSKEIKLIGVTGTNGKTTIVTLLYQLYRALGYRCGMLSTIRYIVDEKVIDASHTTPDSVRINSMLREMVDAGCDYCFMEVSSHAVVQKRTKGLYYAGGIFTNLSHDHLDYHKTFDEYLKAKKLFFDELPETAFALSNLDDRNGRVMLQNTKASKKTYSTTTMADFRAKLIENSFEGLHMDVDKTEVWFRLCGSFNAKNLLAVYGAAILEGQLKEEILSEMSNLKAAEGRFDQFRSDDGITAIVDYAHTPDALDNVLKTIVDIAENGQIITVVGAGGDRDPFKRPKMAAIAAEYSHKVILTSDNPRTEDPEAILDDMEKGLDPVAKKKSIRISDRREAIKTACMLADSGDIILIAGKGHEKYQEINGVRHPFDDMETIKGILTA